MVYVNLCCIYSIEIARKLLEKEIDKCAKMFCHWRSIFYKEKKPTNCTKKFSKFYRHSIEDKYTTEIPSQKSSTSFVFDGVNVSLPLFKTAHDFFERTTRFRVPMFEG